MKTFTYDTLQITTWEMNRAQALKCESDFNAFLKTLPTPEQIDEEIDYLFVKYTPCRVEYNGGALEGGVHKVEIGGVQYTLTLPILRYDYDGLPFGLTHKWASDTGEVNPYRATSFLIKRARMAMMSAGQKSDSGQ